MKNMSSRQKSFFLCMVIFIWGIFLPMGFAECAGLDKIVRVGWYPAAGLQEGTSADSLGGFNYEYLMRIAQYTNWKYEFVFGDFGTLEKRLMAGDIDMMGDIAKTEERLQRYSYCAYPSCYSHTLLLCRPGENRFAYDDYAAYAGMKVGNSGSTFRRTMMDREAQQHAFQIQYKDYLTDDAMLQALDRGEVDTVLISDAIQDKNYKILHEWEPAAQYFVVTKKRPDLLYELNAAMENLQSSDPAIQAHLFEKYFGGDHDAFSIALSREEMAAVAATPELKVLLAENQKPLSYLEGGQPQGFIPDYLKVLSQKTGLKFTYVFCKDYAEMMQRFAAGEWDICGQVYENYETRQYKLVQSYMTLSCGLIYNPEATGAIQQVAVEKENVVLIQHLRKMGLKTMFFDSPQDCLDAVNAKKADAAAMPNTVFEQIAYHEPYVHLIYKAQSNLNLNLCLGVSAGKNPLLFGILSKNSGAISPSIITRLMLSDSSLKPQFTVRDYLQHNLFFIMIILVLLGIIGFFCLWYRRQNHFNACLLKATEAKNTFFNNCRITIHMLQK